MKKSITAFLVLSISFGIGWLLLKSNFTIKNETLNNTSDFKIKDSSSTKFNPKKTILKKETLNSSLNNENPIFKDTSFNLDSLSKIWINGDLGIDKEDLKEITKLTRKKFSKINSTKKWEKIEKREIWESLEGGIASYYYENGVINKIHVRNFGETYQNVQEFYLDSLGIFFVFELEYRYNRPIDYDSSDMIENNDNQFFDFDESVITEVRSYFNQGKLIRQISNQDCGAPNSKDYRIEENERLQNLYKLLTETLSQKENLYPN